MVRDGRGQRSVFLAWAAIAEVCLVGVGVVWLTTTAGIHTGYGLTGSIAVLVLAVLLTFVAALVYLSSRAIRRGVRLALAGLLAAATGAVAPLAIVDLWTGSGIYLLLALAVAGMDILAVHLIRTSGLDRRPKPSA